MTPVHVLLLSITVITSTPSFAEMKLGEATTLSFATIDQAKAVLTSRDEFVQAMSPFDRAARMKTDKDVSQQEYLQFVARNVVAWDDTEKEKVATAFHGIQKELELLCLPFPETVLIIKTTGEEEGNAAYTRANAIVFPKRHLTKSMKELQKLLCHELFHIMSRNSAELREQLYSAIGFVKCRELEFPRELKSRKLTNPDAPRNDHCILVRVQGQDHWAIPILLSRTERYDVKRGGEFFDYLRFQLLLVEAHDNPSGVEPIYDGSKAKVVGLPQVSGFFEQVGRNTGYIIHPEEILADNFALYVLGERKVRSPEVMDHLERVLKDSK